MWRCFHLVLWISPPASLDVHAGTSVVYMDKSVDQRTAGFQERRNRVCADGPLTFFLFALECPMVDDVMQIHTSQNKHV